MSTRLAAACVRTLLDEAETDSRIWLLDGDLADSYSATEFAEQQPDRFIMAGIAEQNMVSMAAGMAACGLRPWVFSFAAFLAFRAADQIRVCISQTGLPVTLVGSHAGGCGGRNGKTHQSLSDLAIMAGFPGMQIWTPCDAADAVFATRSIARSEQPAYFRAPRESCPPLPGEPGALRWLTEPNKKVIVTSGLAAHWALETRERLSDTGDAPSILHVASFAPLAQELEAIITEAEQWFVIEDHVRHGGLAEVVSRLAGRLPDAWFGWPSTWPGGSGSATDLRESCGLDSQAIARHLRDLLGSDR